MNEKLKELAKIRTAYEECLERIAKLVRDDERAKCASDYLADCAAAVEAARLEEREACARLCDDKAKETFSGQCQTWGDYFAKLIRGRTE